MSLAVVGVDFPNKRGPGRRFEIALCRPGDPVELRLEPKNPADPRAIAIYSERGVQLGYLTAERCGRIGSLLASGHSAEAVFQQQTASGAIIRVAFDGEVPSIPAQKPQSPAGEPEFWPDEIPPDF